MAFFGELYLRSTLPFLTEPATAREADFIAEALSLTPGQRVLDLGCGHGRHLARLVERGFDVWGLDIDRVSLVAVEHSHRGRLVRASLFEPPFQSAFDAAYAWYATLFIRDDDALNQAALAAAARALRLGGRLLVHGHNPLLLRHAPQSRFEATLPDGARLFEETWFDPARDILHGHRKLTLGAHSLDGDYLVRCPTLPELGRWAIACGLRVDGVFGGPDASPYDSRSEMLVVSFTRTADRRR